MESRATINGEDILVVAKREYDLLQGIMAQLQNALAEFQKYYQTGKVEHECKYIWTYVKRSRDEFLNALTRAKSRLDRVMAEVDILESLDMSRERAIKALSGGYITLEVELAKKTLDILKE